MLMRTKFILCTPTYILYEHYFCRNKHYCAFFYDLAQIKCAKHGIFFFLYGHFLIFVFENQIYQGDYV